MRIMRLAKFIIIFYEAITINGLKQGFVVSRDDSTIEYYYNDRLHGEIIICSSGNLYRTNYKYGLLHGDQFVSNILSKIKTSYRHNMKHGCATLYDRNKLIQKYNYFNNLYHGECISYYFNGSIKWYAFYIDGLLHGDILHYYSNGSIKQRQTYENDQVSCIKYYKDGSHKLYKKR